MAGGGYGGGQQGQAFSIRGEGRPADEAGRPGGRRYGSTIDLYSCFPIPVFNICDGLGLAPDDPRGPSVTGGLPFFGGAGTVDLLRRNGGPSDAAGERLMRVTGTAQREAWLAHTSPPVEQVRPGLWSVPVPIPDSPLRYTLTYLVAAGRGLVVVDPGWDTEAGWQALAGGLKAAGASPADVTGIVVTHVHPDHHGLSARLREACGAWVAMHPAEADSLSAFQGQDAGFRRDDLAWLRRCGVPGDVAAGLAVTGETMAVVLAMAKPDLLLGHRDLVPLPGRRLRAVWTPGHTPGHLCLHEEAEDVLLTGDHVLPRISPNIGLQPHSAEPPLAAYLRSLELVAPYDTAEALPAHEYRFHGLADRVRMLLAHHERRCDEVIAILARLGPATVWQVTREMSWSRGWAAVTGFMRRAAIAEAGAHLRHLADAGRISVTPPAPDQPERYTLEAGG